MIQDVKVTDLDPDKLSSLPGIVAYIAREGDSLWNIGKKYYGPVSQIKDINELYGEYQAGADLEERGPLTSYQFDDAEPGIVAERR